MTVQLLIAHAVAEARRLARAGGAIGVRRGFCRDAGGVVSPGFPQESSGSGGLWGNRPRHGGLEHLFSGELPYRPFLGSAVVGGGRTPSD